MESSNLYKCNRDEENGKHLFNTRRKWDNKVNTALTVWVIGEQNRKCTVCEDKRNGCQQCSIIKITCELMNEETDHHKYIQTSAQLSSHAEIYVNAIYNSTKNKHTSDSHIE